MIGFMPELYDDELLYSVLSRILCKVRAFNLSCCIRGTVSKSKSKTRCSFSQCL